MGAFISNILFHGVFALSIVGLAMFWISIRWSTPGSILCGIIALYIIGVWLGCCTIMKPIGKDWSE